MKKIILLAFVIANMGLFAQKEFIDNLSNSEDYWSNLPDEQKFAKGSGYKQHLRAKSWYERRFDANGEFKEYAKALEAHKRTIKRTTSNSPCTRKFATCEQYQ